MLQRIKTKLDDGPFETQILEIGAIAQIALKVQIVDVDEVGIVCRVKGMLGGWGELQGRPWSRICWIAMPAEPKM